MTGFTYKSGVASVTITLRCPICLYLRPVTRDMLHAWGTACKPRLEELCCKEHVKEYYKCVYNIEKTAWLSYGVKRLPAKVMKRIKTTGEISNLVHHMLKNKYGIFTDEDK